MASMRDIKRRKESIQSTGQITKAMKLVSTVKLQKAKTRAENSQPYFNYMYQTVSSILAKSSTLSHPYLNPGSSPKKAIIVITSNRGLAGGYNSNVIKLVTGSGIPKEEAVIFAVGRKGRDTLARRGYEIKADYSEVINEPMFRDAVDIGRDVLDAFVNNEVGEIYLAYTVFKNTVVHIPTLLKLLPVEKKAEGAEGNSEGNSRENSKGNAEGNSGENSGENSLESLTLMNYEPAAEEALDLIIPKYINSLIYGALVQALASENGARMQAMDSATNNAEDMIADLSLKYNRARQGSITQELTEIIAGANAIN